MTTRILVIQFPSGDYAGSPLTARTSNPELAGTFREHERQSAETAATSLGGRVVALTRNDAGRLVEVAS